MQWMCALMMYTLMITCHCSSSGSTKFSQCSGEDFETLIIRGGGVCLRNQPSPSDVVGTAECGNGRLDEGEQCDCGTPEVKYYLFNGNTKE